MPTTFQNHTVFSLKEVANSIQKTLALRYTKSYWIKAEMIKLNFYSYSGHCYPDLVEKKEGKVIAQMRAVIWKGDYEFINKKFLHVLKEPLKDGSNILFLAQIQFDGMHGISLRIVDIDPSFSLGELEREKTETLLKLQQEGLINRNKLLQLPLLPKRIAIISVETSKGYIDFLKILQNNSYNFKFFCHLFPANLQGDKAVTTIRKQLNNIKKCIDLFDIVVIVRGGGGDVGLSAFNDYQLAKDVALFPLPVFTGIGHATNETIVEMIAHKNAITPTEIANILIQKFQKVSLFLQQAEQKLIVHLEKKLKNEQFYFQQSTKLLIALTEGLLAKERNKIDQIGNTLLQQTKFILKQQKEKQEDLLFNLRKITTLFIENEHAKLKMSSEKLSILDPKNILKRGFSITYFNGKIVTESTPLQLDDIIETQLTESRIKSKITELPSS